MMTVPVNHAERMSVVSTCAHGGALIHRINYRVIVCGDDPCDVNFNSSICKGYRRHRKLTSSPPPHPMTKDPLPVHKSASMYHVFITSGCESQWNVGQRQLEDKIKWMDTKGTSVASLLGDVYKSF